MCDPRNPIFVSFLQLRIILWNNSDANSFLGYKLQPITAGIFSTTNALSVEGCTLFLSYFTMSLEIVWEMRDEIIMKGNRHVFDSFVLAYANTMWRLGNFFWSILLSTIRNLLVNFAPTKLGDPFPTAFETNFSKRMEKYIAADRRRSQRLSLPIQWGEVLSSLIWRISTAWSTNHAKSC